MKFEYIYYSYIYIKNNIYFCLVFHIVSFKQHVFSSLYDAQLLSQIPPLYQYVKFTFTLHDIY